VSQVVKNGTLRTPLPSHHATFWRRCRLFPRSEESEAKETPGEFQSMITAVLKGTGTTPHLPIEWCRALVRSARNEAHETSQRIRRRTIHLARRIRERARRRGYQDGIQAATRETEEVLAGIRERYADAVNKAEHDALSLAYRLAEKIVHHTFEQHPETLLPFLSRSLQILKRGRNFRLSYNPRYERSIQLAAPTLPAGLTLLADPTLKDLGFLLSCEEGAVESAWHEALKELEIDSIRASSRQEEG
jgi:flagellar biosynthesis/type III secretory pathway protein FliH